MKYNLLDAINIFLFIILIIVIINKINNFENFNNVLCGGICSTDHECSIDFKCNRQKKSCCKNIS